MGWSEPKIGIHSILVSIPAYLLKVLLLKTYLFRNLLARVTANRMDLASPR